MKKHNAQADESVSGADRRGRPRYCIKGAMVEYVKVEFLAFLDKDMRQRDDLGNVSEGGMLMMAEEDFDVGQNLSLCLLIPGVSESLKMRGSVAWTSACEAAPRHKVGVKFNMCGLEAAKTLSSLAELYRQNPDRVVLYVKSD